ncbi:hypothetical protein NDU88_002892 [Pleurodeles waltl]|uniref:Uncharacterized protein n=1 Tax=Pleurodeles waltl TaxID=8319 RepID=A0AAV7VBV0_PLEWA|nr:hypothetical protein NDU88_002892 [Pleurodeles waltl]
MEIAGAQHCCPNLLRPFWSFQCSVYSFLLLRRGQTHSWAAGHGGRGSPTPPRPPRGNGQESGRTAQPRLTRLKRGSPHRVAHLFSTGIDAIISPGRGTSIWPLLLRGAPDLNGLLARSSFICGQAPVLGPGCAGLSQTGDPPSQGSPSPGSPLLSEPGATESESPRANKGRRPHRSTIRRGPQVTVRSRHLSAAHGTHSGGGLISGRAPVHGLVETPSARPPSWETYRSVATSAHGSGRADTGDGGLINVWELAGTSRAV